MAPTTSVGAMEPSLVHAAVSRGAVELDVVNNLHVEDPRPDEVVVDVAYCGICHSDLSFHDLTVGSDACVVLGHEASGQVAAIGGAVTSVAVGDLVMLTPVGSCGHCYWCVRDQPSLCGGGAALSSGVRSDGTSPLSIDDAVTQRGLGVAGFSQQTVVQERSVVRLDPETPLDIACVIGCAVQTGAGAVFNAARVEAGASVLVVGLGGIGIATVQAARISGAGPIIVSDPVAERRAAAVDLGATHAIDPNEDDVVARVFELTGGVGADYAFEAAGVASLVDGCIQAARVGGTTVLVGTDTSMSTVEVMPLQLAAQGRRVIGTLLGDCHPQRDIPRLVALWRSGALNLEAMISHRLPLAEINAGFDHLRNANGIRTVLTVGGTP